jgi:hypothetical protein
VSITLTSKVSVVLTIHKKRWEDLTVVEFEWLALKSQFLYTPNDNILIVSYSLFNSMGMKLGTGQLIDGGLLKFENGLTVVPDADVYGN